MYVSEFDINTCKKIKLDSSHRHPLKSNKEETIDLDDRSIIEITYLWQYKTYDCLLFGIARNPAQYFGYALEAVANHFPHYLEEIFVLSPEITHYQTKTTLGSEAEYDDWEMLPMVTTIAMLQCTTDCEWLLAMWFQDRIGVPDSGITKQIRAIDWGRHAFKYEP